jgi:uncharacterized membrane-anchored protein
MKRAAILWLGLIATLVAVNLSVWGFEKIRTEGKVVYLELAPMDPRSLMQGDYMALRLVVAANARDALDEAMYAAQDEATEKDIKNEFVPLESGYVVVEPDEFNVGRYHRVQPKPLPRSDKEIALPFRRSREGTVQVVTSDFFFAEGRAKEFDAARYGEFRVDDKGRSSPACASLPSRLYEKKTDRMATSGRFFLGLA